MNLVILNPNLNYENNHHNHSDNFGNSQKIKIKNNRKHALLSLENTPYRERVGIPLNSQKSATSKASLVSEIGVVKTKYRAIDIVLTYCNKGIINQDQLHSAYKIRRAFRLITEGIQMRVTQYKDPVFQVQNSEPFNENTHDILIQELYTDWVDKMTVLKHPVGPILDIIIDEDSLSAVCKKWKKRNGWAKLFLQSSLDIYRDIYIAKIG